MPEAQLLHELIEVSAHRTPTAAALIHGASQTDYAALATAVQGFASGLMRLGLQRGERVGIYLEKRPAGVEAMAGPLPQNPNGKIDRKLLATAWVDRKATVHAG